MIPRLRKRTNHTHGLSRISLHQRANHVSTHILTNGLLHIHLTRTYSQEALMAATRKKQDPAALDLISVAFVTFEHEESKRRCLEDYRYSRRGFCR